MQRTKICERSRIRNKIQRNKIYAHFLLPNQNVACALRQASNCVCVESNKDVQAKISANDCITGGYLPPPTPSVLRISSVVLKIAARKLHKETLRQQLRVFFSLDSILEKNCKNIF